MDNSNNDSHINYVKNGENRKINRKQQENGKKSPYSRNSHSEKTAVKTSQKFTNGMTPEMIIAEKRKAAKKRMIKNNAKSVGIIFAIVIVVSVSIAFVGISCINDLLAVHISEKDKISVEVVIEDGMDTGDVIDELHEAGAINNAIFCKIAAKFIGYTNEGYIARTYEFNRSMGLEKMLDEIKGKSSTAAQTVTLTFPEGYTADQIIDMLAENKVCTREKLIAAITETDFAEEFDFLESVTNRNSRYNWLEGYLFPDTYEFYIGESAVSVIKKFLNNFENKWTDNYAQKADEKGLTLDEIVILASIVEKEAVGADMSVVGSILINRLDAGMQLGCDSTSNYIDMNTSGLTDTQIGEYDKIYDTYICGSLPVGSICNPGVDAIEAVLNSPDTEYYYFLHDANNEFRAAKTLAEHQNNASTYGLAGQ
ncbi:MAG: endolytic transglycosylase MltG [Clostridia bacterium]|nr:endolytic transglycosylase MltG [Clostridia bacterium]